jgi:hypothetical protein
VQLNHAKPLMFSGESALNDGQEWAEIFVHRDIKPDKG